MSADNGIYIGRFLRKWRCGKCDGGAFPEHSVRCTKREDYTRGDGSYVYRVITAQAIENCDEDYKFPKELTAAYRVEYYGRSEVFDSEEDAWNEARRLESEIMGSEFPVLEYGISMISYDVPFPDITPEVAASYIDWYWNQQEKKAEESRAKEVTVKCLVTKGMFQSEYFVFVQDYPSLTPVIWRGWVDRSLVRVDYSKGMTMEGYHFGELHCYKVKEEVQEEDLGSGTRSQLMTLVEFPDGGFGARRLWIEPRMVTGQW